MDGHIVQCTARVVVEINTIASDGLLFFNSFSWRYLFIWSNKSFVSVKTFASKDH